MKNAPKSFIIYALYFICITSLSAQYTTSNFLPGILISDGLKAPGRMAVDTNDYIYTTDAFQKNIVKYDGQGNYIKTITTALTPLSIALNEKNQLFVGDELTGSIYKVSPNGSKTLFYEGTSMPNSMVFGLNNILYIVDSQLKKVIGLDVSGTVVKEFTYNTFTFPTGIAFDKQNNHIIVSEHGGIGEDVQTCGGGSMSWGTTGPLTTIYIFDIDGNLIKNFGCFGTKDGLFHRIQGVTVGTCGNIYAVDPYLGRVNVFDANGNYITKFGTQGDGLGQFNLPMGIVFTSDNRLFVSSMNKGAIDVFSISSTLPTSTITSSDQVICMGASTDVTVAFTGIAPWTFTYTLNGLNPQIKTATESPYVLPVSEEGLYEITALTDGNNAIGKCFTGSANIQVSTAPPTATMITPAFSKCSDDGTGVEIQFTGIAPFTFTYTIDGLNPTEITSTTNTYNLSVQESGLYEIAALSDAGCSGSITGTTSVTVYPLPTATFTSDDDGLFINPGEIAPINIAFTGTAPYTFVYNKDKDKANLISITTYDNPYTLNVSEEDTYQITSITDLYCSNNAWQDYFDIIFNDIVLPTANLLTKNIEICKDETTTLTINLTGIAPWTFSYTVDGLNATEITTSTSPFLLSTSTSGEYALSTIFDANNNAGSVSGTAQVIVNPLPVLYLGPAINICEGNSAYVLDAGIFDSYLWSDGSTNRFLEVSATGSYSVTVTNTQGCSTTASVSATVHSLATADFFYDANRLEVQFISEATNEATHFWEFGDGSTSTEESPIHTYDKKGSYVVTHDALSNYCQTSQKTESIQVGSTDTNEVIVIYPNPSYGEFTLKITPVAPILTDISIEITSLSGQTIYREILNPMNETTYDGRIYKKINLSNFIKGVYLINVNARNFTGQEKLILKD